MRSASALETISQQSFFNQILKCTRTKNITSGKILHARIIKTGKLTCTFIANSLLNFYSKCHHLSEANIAFQDIQEKDIVSWNSIINGYSQLGGSQNSIFALKLFKQLTRQAGLFPNGHTFSGFFTAASILVDGFAGKQGHSIVIKISGCDDVFVGSSLVNMYCKSGLVDDARKVFDEMPHRNSTTWATMISGYAMCRLTDYALELFKMMMWEMEEGVNEFVLTSVISAFTLKEFIHIGKQLHGLAIKFGLLSFVTVGNSIVTMYSKCGDLDYAVQSFELADDKNSITWTAMITGFAQSGDCLKALALFSKMHYAGMKSSEFTLVGVLNACTDSKGVEKGKQVHGCLVKSGYESQIFIMTALVDMYAKCGFVDDARKGFYCLQEPDIVLWTSMIGGYVQNGDNESAIDLYCKMQEEGIMPNELTMASVLKACSSLAAFEQGKQIHAHTVKFGFGLEAPIGSALSTMYAKCGSLEDGNLVFRRMPARDVISWNSVISGLSQNGHGEEALELFEEMRLEGTKPDHVTFVNVLTSCSHTGFVERGWVYFRMMSSEYDISPRVEHFACMVDILSRAGKLYEAKELIEAAKCDHGSSLWRILLSACRNYNNYELGAYAGEKLMKLGTEESSAYVLLSSIYKAMGMWEDVERVRRLMSIRGVGKEPGCSWIDLKNHMHVFVVGDHSHPQIKEIRADVLSLSKLMKNKSHEPACDLSLTICEA
ncbi:pentatricopeptide repeat-containing protein At2g33680 [Apium graveolens]|uniref:pentatricopeptide repeat-containing protein At2g33680 n=1 Tax=Apium graveolens TaxID=4045 RepID=UPI003D78C97C